MFTSGGKRFQGILRESVGGKCIAVHEVRGFERVEGGSACDCETAHVFLREKRKAETRGRDLALNGDREISRFHPEKIRRDRPLNPSSSRKRARECCTYDDSLCASFFSFLVLHFLILFFFFENTF